MRLLPCEYPTAVRCVDIGEPLGALTDVTDYGRVQLFVTFGSRLLCSVAIPNHHRDIGTSWLRDAVADGLAAELGGMTGALDCRASLAAPSAALAERLAQHAAADSGLAADVPVSVVVATHDRPDELRNCLRGLALQETSRPLQIIVVDNNPSSGLTPPVVDRFPGVLRISETRPGVSCARNAGVAAATGHIVVTTDDDVSMPPDWLEKLLAPFVRSEVAAVTGNVLPLELETRAQCLFEAYGGLGRGFRRRELGLDWFTSYRRRPVPTWQLGGTANAAFRAEVFSHPDIGPMDEALGPGMPSGVGEDTYLFYKILKAGYTHVYEPDAWVWHRHRRTMRALCRQIYGYSKGHIAYHLTTLLKDRDRRALARLLVPVSRSHLWRIRRRLRGRSVFPLWMILLELCGNLVGPFALWRSWRRVKRDRRRARQTPVMNSALGDGQPGGPGDGSGKLGGPCGTERGA